MATSILPGPEPATPTQDYKFVSTVPHNMKCILCSKAARNPRQHEACGRLFCKACIDNYDSKVCPSCNKEGSQYFMDRRSQDEIHQMKVKCENVDDGCDWVGTVNTIQDHLNLCDFSLFLCPNQCQEDGKVVQVMKKNLDDHITKHCPNRTEMCPLCGNIGKQNVHEHEQLCPRKVVNCPQTGCFDSMEREKLLVHMESVCKFTEVDCKFKDFGCNVRKVRMFIKQHEEDVQLHLDLARKKIIQLEETVSLLAEEVVDVLDDSGSFTFRLQNFKSIHKNDEKFSSKPFYTRPGGYKMLIRVHTNGYDDAKGTHLSIYVKLVEGRNDDALSWPFLGTAIFELLNQQNNSHHHTRELHFEKSDDARVNSGWGHTKFIPHSMLVETSTVKYLRKNTLFFRITVIEEHDLKPWLECPCRL